MDLLGLLAHGELAVNGRLAVASNATFIGHVAHGEQRVTCVYKPITGERPLWDFPDGSLAAREVASYLVSEAAGWHVVPPTVLRTDGPAGAGMCQVWLEQPGTPGWVDVVAPDDVPSGTIPVLEGIDGDGSPVVLVHADRPELRRLALFDVVINNADRKGGHILTGDRGVAEHMATIVGIDHGVSCHAEPKLRTVLWGWAGTALDAAERDELERIRAMLGGELGSQLAELLTETELIAMDERVSALLQDGRMPVPEGRMPVPWPPF
ncbi:SCO1664 family protein [Phytoactinopolyspora halophila]|uniref:SCO1664 family protein n=1 Tax=Phytoactinopolyspora halophila TaxID=1981511 RepID=UPI001B8C87D1|nr:SCO1664 family protein [Phytoactinopolyspora halophila]